MRTKKTTHHSILNRLAFVLICLALFIYMAWVEPNWVEINVHKVSTNNAANQIRIAQLSDLHLRSIGKRETSIIEALRQAKPDLIILSGDVIDRADALPVLDKFLRLLGPTPMVAVLGNWEYWGNVNLDELRELYGKRYAVKLLVNEEATYRIRSRYLTVFGMDDYTGGTPITKTLPQSRENSTKILVEHSPGWFENAITESQANRFDLCLSGHTHGGQVTLLGFPIWTPRGSGAFVSGFYDLQICPLYVSRGVGTSMLPIRVGARPEIAIFDL